MMDELDGVDVDVFEVDDAGRSWSTWEVAPEDLSLDVMLTVGVDDEVDRILMGRI